MRRERQAGMTPGTFEFPLHGWQFCCADETGVNHSAGGLSGPFRERGFPKQRKVKDSGLGRERCLWGDVSLSLKAWRTGCKPGELGPGFGNPGPSASGCRSRRIGVPSPINPKAAQPQPRGPSPENQYGLSVIRKVGGFFLRILQLKSEVTYQSSVQLV